jgi:hypothetical protein
MYEEADFTIIAAIASSARRLAGTNDQNRCTAMIIDLFY